MEEALGEARVAQQGLLGELSGAMETQEADIREAERLRAMLAERDAALTEGAPFVSPPPRVHAFTLSCSHALTHPTVRPSTVTSRCGAARRSRGRGGTIATV